MSFFERLSNGWELAQTSFKTINENRSLMLFPVLSVISLVLILATFAGGTFFLWGNHLSNLSDNKQVSKILELGAIFIYYLVNYFIIVYFNSALIFCASKVLNGEETQLSDGIAFANTRINKIFGWAILSATVGTLLQVLHNMGRIGEFIAGLIGMAWSIMTFFVVPVLIFEDKGVIDSVKESGRIMRDKWGESLAANVSFGIFHFFGFLAAIFVGYLLISVNVILGIFVAILLVILVSTFFATAHTIFVAAVYNRVNGRPYGDFDGGMLDSAFIQKR
jgi:hypothetical protein